MNENGEFVELVRIGDPVEADLLAAFLEDGDITFQVVNRSGAGFMSGLVPRAANPVLFRVLEDDLERGKRLIEEYRAIQKSSIPPDDSFEEGSDDESEGESAEDDSEGADEETSDK